MAKSNSLMKSILAKKPGKQACIIKSQKCMSYWGPKFLLGKALKVHSMLEYSYSGIRQDNRNTLLRKDPSVDGLKTGHLSESGYHLVATAKRDERRLIAVVMGAKSQAIRAEEALKLLNYGYRN